jgi:ligand-binding SRPBCC domain-containing protein
MIRLEETTIIHAPIGLCFDLARNVEVHLAGNVHSGEQTVATGGVTSGLIGLGQQVTWRAKHFGVWRELTSKITALEPPIYFQDVMLRGAFKSMTHDHHFLTLPSGVTEMKDIFVFAAPLPVLGLIAERLVLRRYMQALLHERNVALKTIAEAGGVVV